MKTRILAGLTAGTLLLLLLFLGPVWLILLVILVCSALAYEEYDRLFFPIRSAPRRVKVVLLIGLTIVAVHLNPSTLGTDLWLSFVLLCGIHVLKVRQTGEAARSVRELTLELLGYVYVVSLFGFLLPVIESGEGGRYCLLLLFLIVFVGDTAAYFFGKWFGKHPLAPHVSPKKTVEGALAAVAAAIGATALWSLVFCVHRDPPNLFLRVMLFAPVGSILAQLGDLFESMLKRSQSRKDSGAFLPGHGGLLDRVDGLALSTPVFFFYLLYVVEG